MAVVEREDRGQVAIVRLNRPEAKNAISPEVSTTMAALLDDLHQRGLLATMLVVMATEFGRTPQINPVTAGRGHHPSAFTWWLAGGGVKGGYVHGKSDATGSAPAEDPVHPAELLATIYHAVGIAPDTIVYNHLNQPRELVKAQAVTKLFA